MKVIQFKDALEVFTKQGVVCASENATKLMLAAERLNQPAIIVDDDGTLALDLRLNPRLELFIELLPNNQVNAVMFDDVTRKLISLRSSTVSELIALIDKNGN